MSDLESNVKGVRDRIERLVALYNDPSSVTNTDLAELEFLSVDDAVDQFDEDGDFIGDEDQVREAVETELRDNLPLEIVGIWKGNGRDEAEYKGCEVVFCTGGPHIELDTTDGQVHGYWSSERCSVSVDREVCDFYDSLFDS